MLTKQRTAEQIRKRISYMEFNELYEWGSKTLNLNHQLATVLLWKFHILKDSRNGYGSRRMSYIAEESIWQVISDHNPLATETELNQINREACTKAFNIDTIINAQKGA